MSYIQIWREREREREKGGGGQIKRETAGDKRRNRVEEDELEREERNSDLKF